MVRLEKFPIFQADYFDFEYIFTNQGRSHAFKTGGAQAAKIILGPFYLKKWRGPTLLLV